MGKNLKYILIIVLVISGFTINVYSQPSVYNVEKTAFSSPVYSEIAPVVFGRGVIFCSDKRVSIIRKRTFDNERLFNIYITEPVDSVKWNKPIQVKGDGVSMVFYGPVCIAPDYSTIYFTSSLFSGRAARKKKLKNPLGIFSGRLSENVIYDIKPFEYNNQAYNVAHPSVSSDGKYLFFASDMPGGQGKSDLYYCEKVNGKWSAPVNMGSKVNSPSRENYPFSHPSGRLYFSSDRPGTGSWMGGMDIYYTSLIFGEWDEPVAMPAPINSSSDDFAFTAADNLQNGYFTRFNGRNDDIFRYNSTIKRVVNCDSLKINNFCYEFVEENAIKFDTLPVPFKFIWKFGDGKSAEGIKVQHCYEKPGDYIIHLDIMNLLTDEVETDQRTYNLEIREFEQPYISGPDKCIVNQPIKLSADSTNLPGWDIKQFYWNLGDETVLIGKDVDKTYIRPGSYNIQLIVTGAPDANGMAREACVTKNIVVRRQP